MPAGHTRGVGGSAGGRAWEAGSGLPSSREYSTYGKGYVIEKDPSNIDWRGAEKNILARPKSNKPDTLRINIWK